MDWITILMAFSFVPALASNPGEPGLVDIKFPSHKLPVALTQAYVYSHTSIWLNAFFNGIIIYAYSKTYVSNHAPLLQVNGQLCFVGPRLIIN